MTQRLRRVASASDPADGRHTRIIPSGNEAGFYHLAELSLARDHRRHVEAGKFDLARLFRPVECLQAPVVKRTAFFKLQRTDGVCDPFDGIRERMCKVIERINAPGIPRSMMGRMQHTINDRISHDHIRRSHIDLGAKHLFPILVLAFLHLLEKLQVLFDASVSIGTFLARMLQIATSIMDFLTRLVIDIRKTHADQLAGEFIQLRKIVRCIMDRFLPMEAKPLHILQNGIHILDLFLCRVRIIEADIRLPVILLSNAKIETDALHMPDVKVSIRFRRKTRQHPIIRIDMICNIFIDFCFDKIRSFSFFFHSSPPFCHYTFKVFSLYFSTIQE